VVLELVEIMTYDSAFVTDELIQQRSDAGCQRPDHLANFLAGGLRTPIDGGITADDIAAIRIPSLQFHGRDDRVVPLTRAR
jgi:2-hydroxy-6-oxonona-2,4-dienedioate hydrolase